MTSKSVYAFPSAEEPTLSEVGGKGLSLMIGSKQGLPVPPGFILTVTFFAPWLSHLKTTQTWTDFLNAKDTELAKICTNLKKNVDKLSFTKQQTEELSQALQQYEQNCLFAVRSSSPEEDLEGSSFAGGYETLLGVTAKNIESAVREAFISCLDYRVVVYKRENGFAVTDPKIAVIIQKQIASDIAGVGFSLNPVTNNYDEAVFTANWGLGETVVAGTVTPDTCTINKVSLQIHNKTLGTKETTISLMKSGGTKVVAKHRSDEFTLSDEQIRELTKLIITVEKLYNKPIDIEWAYEKDVLFLLQARPVSAYVPLSPEMITLPGEQKHLYLDVTISVQGMYQQISVTGTSFFRTLLGTAGKIVFLRDVTTNITTAIPWITHGRLYLNFSNLLKLIGKKKILRVITFFDPLAAKIIESRDEAEYMSSTPKWKLFPVGLLFRLPKIALHVHEAEKFPEQTHRKVEQRLERFLQKVQNLAEKEMSLTMLAPKLIHSMFTDVFFNTVPLFILGRLTLGKMKKLAGKDLEAAFAPLEVALANNTTTEMGLALYHVATLLPDGFTQKEFREGIKQNGLPENFLSAWKEFLKTYGHRGPSEIDIAAPRYRDNPQFLIDLLLSLRKTNKIDNPQAKFEQNQRASKKAYEYLFEKIQEKNTSQAQKFASLYKIFVTFGGYREIHKYYLVFVTDILRRKMLKEAQVLYDAGRLRSIEQVFDLTLVDIDKAKQDPSFDLMKQAKQNKKFSDRLAHVSQLPTVIDSRGFIPHAPKPPFREGEVVGTPVSTGIVRGRIKILHTADEKVLNKGEILVAKATDPGWTPLFVNAAAVILEVGGVLQHGALVAREYGLPCVTGVENAINLWKDGDLVEVDGSTGTIRVIKEK